MEQESSNVLLMTGRRHKSTTPWVLARIAVALVSSVSVSALLALALAPQAASAVAVPGVSAGHGNVVPGPPTHLTATIRNHQVILNWQAPKVTPTAGVSRDYLVIWQAPPMLPLTAEVDTHSTLTDYTSVFGPGTYKVVAKNRTGVGPPSKSVTVCGNESVTAHRTCPPT